MAMHFETVVKYEMQTCSLSTISADCHWRVLKIVLTPYCLSSCNILTHMMKDEKQ